jgi:hypothetical protein
MKMMTGGAGAAAGVVTIGPAGLVLGPLVTIGSPILASRWLTSAKGLRYLTKSLKEAQSIPTSRKQHFFRAFGRKMNQSIIEMVKDDPSMKEPAQAYLEEMEKWNQYQ